MLVVNLVLDVPACPNENPNGNTGVRYYTRQPATPMTSTLVNERRHFLEQRQPWYCWCEWHYCFMGSDLRDKLTRIQAGRRMTSVTACGPAVAYSDAAGDPTSKDDSTTTNNDEELEATFAGTEWPVKKEDTQNDAPIFTVDGLRSPPSPVAFLRASTSSSIPSAPFTGDGYTASKVENTLVLHLGGMVFPATDTSVAEDDFANVGVVGVDLEIRQTIWQDRNDRLTYSLSGTGREAPSG